MNRSANPIADILQLLLLLVFLPFILLVLGPVLVIAALFGRFSLGALKIRPGKYHPRGRLWALVLGLFVWGLTWGGLAWFWPSNLFQPAITPSPINTITQNTVTPTHTPTNVPSANTSTPAQPTQPATPTATTTATPLPSPTETTAPPPPPTPTLTLTSLPATPTPTPTAVLPTATPSSLQPDDPDQLLTIANDSLVQYLEGGAIDDLSVLGGLWAGEALPAVQSFGRQINLKYQQPLSVTYQLIGSPSLTPLAENRIIVQVRELWVFEDSTHRQESLSDYDYTLQLVEGQWRIVAYQFQALPLPTTAIPISNTGIISQTDDGP